MEIFRCSVFFLLAICFNAGLLNCQSCDFEKDLCGWSQYKKDKFDWTRSAGKTGSSGTGPSSDHTLLVKTLNVTTNGGTANGAPCVFPFQYLGKQYSNCIASGFNTWCATTSDYGKDQKWGYCNAVGYYIFIETSSPRRNGDNAIVLSPQLTGTKCLTLWYHMYGPHIDQLIIKTMANNVMNPALWQKKGTQGNAWLNANVTINGNGTLSNYQIAIEATRGTSYKGDISIDDVTIKDGSCDSSASKTCTFEKDICGFKQEQGTDNFDWKRHQGHTPSTGTGPHVDHTLGTALGFYTYVEASGLRRGQKGRMSKNFTGLSKDGSCLEFYYHMFGRLQGTLNVYVNPPATGSMGTPAFSVAGQQGNLWLKGQASVNTTFALVVFEAVAGLGYLSDMALDDITVLDGLCKVHGECDFQKDLCTWYNIPNTEDDFDWISGSGGTPSSFTGPKSDRNGNATGKYLYLESSTPRRTGEKTRLASQLFNQTGSTGQCFLFYYHMSGSQIGALNIYVNNSGTERLVWTLKGTQQNQWKNGQVNVGLGTGSYKIIVEGVQGTGYQGDIAIDDFTLKPGSCNIVPAQADPSAQPATTLVPATQITTTPRPNSDYSCDFENGICKNWYQDKKSDQLDWTLAKGATSSGGTGPSTDHTKNNQFGQYLYLETSFQRPNNVARLFSQQIAATSGSGGKCLKFYYHMYGPHVNSLNVYVFVGNNYTGQPFWSRSGSQGNQWIMGQVTLYAGQPFQAVFEATVGTSYQGDIAIDDLSLTDGKCIQPSTTCTFENNQCGYTDDSGADIKLQWTRQSLHTSSSSTGPKADHTLQSASGFYIYTEATGRTRGDVARILSPIESATSGACLQFWYHMYGAGMGSLAVYLKMANRLSNRPIWSEAGDKGDEWRKASVTINTKSAYQIAFQGIIGTTYQSDIALDDIKLTLGPCPPPGFCDFESGMCDYTNLKSDHFDWIVGSGGTPSIFTGPKFDHTTGKKNGSYIFLESSFPRKENETAVFQSQQFNAVAGQKRCLSFWYHMYGADIGDLEVIYKVFSGSTPNKVIWKLRGQQQISEDDLWKNARVPIDMNADHLIMFKGTIGSGYRGDIAIDDIQVTTLSCIIQPASANPNPTPSVPPTTIPLTRPSTQAPSLLGCNFENGFCQLMHSQTGAFNWTIRQGFTDSQGTGPSTDHTFGKGAVGPNGPGSIRHSGGKCIHVKDGAFTKPAENKPVVTYNNCGQDRLEFLFSNGQLILKMHNMCLGPITSASAGTVIGVKSSCTDRWTLLPNGAFQLAGTALCMSSYRESTNPANNQNIVLSKDCTGISKQWTFTPTMGHYAFIESSSPRKENDTAQLISKPTSGSQCLNFWYHMYGAHINRLNIYVKNPNSKVLGTPVWSRYGSHGDIWKPAHVFMNYRGPYVYVIEAIRGKGFQGDIAIDDITVTSNCAAPLECSFEETSPALCGWTNLKSGQFDWAIGQARTASVGTGPTADHTYNDDQGKYLYIETSGNIQKGWKAQIQSPSYLGNSNVNGQCFQFWYHMFGASIGTLNVYIVTAGQTLTNPAWSKTSNQGDKWSIGQVTIYSQSAYKLVFEGIRGSSYTGDISIDDLKMHDGPCNRQGTCDFENDKCTWKNTPNGDTFDWLIGRGNTPSTWTGPLTDHTLQNGNGKYMFIEASLPRKQGDTARLISETMTKHWSTKVPYCLRFWYHMTGSGIGTLNLYVKTGTGKLNEQLIWRLSGNQAKLWKSGTAPIYSSLDYQLVFEAITGKDVQGDIALDDIVYTLGNCPIYPAQADPSFTTTMAPTTTLSPKGLLACDFEAKTTCNWMQDVGDKFNWTIHQGSTSSSDTGPKADHTLGNRTGQYIYIETSAPMRDGYNARLISPKIQSDKVTGTSHCFQFWYHMYGPHVDSMNVYIRSGGRDQLVWNRVGDNGNMWKKAQVDIVSATLEYKIIIEGIRGTGYKGDISVDDVDVLDGVCPMPDLCDFEHGKCGYTDDTTAEATWTRNKGSTASALTGPSSDHTYQTTEGYYMYTEASGRRKQGDKYRLVSPVIADNQPYCLHFWFHMRGFHIGKLNVYVKTSNGGSSLAWQRIGNHGDTWKFARTNIRPRAGRQIVFEGVRGWSFIGDIAIDDVRMIQGYCPPPGDCSFETGMCAYTNVKTKAGTTTESDEFDWVIGSGATPSSFTGPSTDHTTGSAQGSYIYIEASTGKNGDRAQLISEDFYPTYGRCVQFWAHMKGAGIGMLNVYLRGQNDTASTMRKIWTLSGEQANGQWFSAQAPIASLSDYQIVFEGTQTSAYTGDIALDDIIYTNFRCQNHPPSSVPPISTTPFPTTPTTTLAPTLAPNQYTCNFTFDKCNWLDDASANFNWTRAQGGTSSQGTGPDGDHTVGASGWYVFIETSWPRKQNETARLMSSLIPATSQMCFEFWYHMYGDHIANLTVYSKTNNGMTVLWQKAGTQGPRWRHATVDVSSSSQFSIVVEGMAGSGYRGDISLDDLHINNGACPPSAECTFEDPNLCGWKNIHDDNFDWKRDNAGTSSSRTGPSQDHTYGTAAGYYMYIEASNPRSKGHRSWLLSQDYKPTLGRCLSFWYHMYGTDIGELNVLISVNGSRSSPIWTQSGNQGNLWRPSRVTIKSPVKHNVIFEGRTMDSYRGDIAIDDVMISEGPCPDPGNCDFERDLCGYTNRDNIDQFDWQVASGTTSSFSTGPSTDHSTGNKFGRYLFIESSWPRQTYDRATIVSETIPTTGEGKCVQFWYHMKGNHIGELAVYMRVGFDISESHVWELFGDQQGSSTTNGGWRQGQAPLLSRGKNLEIRFVGVRGTGYQGDIAVDDVTVVDYHSGCNVLPTTAVPTSTNFEVGLNKWKQLTNDQFDWKRHKGWTGSVGTGPSVDHTSNTTKGYYMYIETSWPRKENETAALVSPTLVGSGTKRRMCLWFAYHMYGPHVNTLRVYIKSQNQVKPTIWQRTGSQGPDWRHGEAQIDILQNTQVIIEATRGTSYKGDIAIDDLEFYYGDCATSATCTFESPNICNWWVDTRTSIKWQRISGSTLSTRTGPSNDHTYETPQGHYMFIETSQGGINSLARMYSSWVYSTGQHCIQFFYHMYGQDIGSLSVYVTYSGSNVRYRNFYKRGNQNATWVMGQASVTKKGWFQMIVEARRGNGPRGDIAVDDFRVRDGACPAEGDCDFEHLDFCSWKQEGANDKFKDHFNWIIGSGRTGSVFTGPNIDHTTQTAGGYYAFMEASAPRVIGDKAIIKSLIFPATTGSGRCFSFWYHMYGATIGDLNVYLRNVDNNAQVTGSQVMWQLSGNQGSQWNQARIPLVVTSDYQLSIEATRGSGFTGDIAIDDIVFTIGNCGFMPTGAWPAGRTTPTPTPVVTTVGPTTGNTGKDCNFDQSLCAPWKTNSSKPTFLWKRHQGSTSSVGTGPKVDHTQGTDQGSYVYIETSSPAQTNNSALLYTDNVPDQLDSCMNFWFHMYGPHVGTLNVFLIYNGNKTLTWKRVGTQGDEWKHGHVEIPRSTKNQPLSIAFEGIRGNGYAGDIALDDISIVQRPCPASRECTFESISFSDSSSNNLCGWVNAKNTDQFDWTIATGSTPSVKTGPRNDHTYNSSQGHYLYIESSWPRKSGDVADFITANFYQTTKGQCFTFWYHMFGSTIGNLTLFMRVNQNGRDVDTLLWSKSRNEFNRWRPAMVTLKSSSQFKLMFRGTVGKSYTGDIAVDDLLLKDGECPLPGDCNFEDFQQCTYLQGLNGVDDDFDWLRGHGGTSSWNTGPSKDNTKGDKTGHYMYTEASAPRKTGDKAMLISQLFNPTSSTTGKCLRFYRHMLGPHIGTLNVKIRQEGKDSLIWSDSGNQGDVWIPSQAPVYSKTPYRLIFEAVRGTSYQGDIAIDDINFNNNFYPCSYIPSDAAPPTLPPTTITPADSNCTFDAGVCRWSQSKNDNFDWKLVKGRTGSTGTGPLGDHTSGDGQYVYVEASAPRKPNDTAILTSPPIRPQSGGVCFKFAYHMHGPHIGNLNIYKVDGTKRTLIWTRSGTQGNQWRNGQVNIRGVRTIFNLEVEGVRGLSYAGDISVDDFALNDGWCGTPEHCDFENNQCYLSNYAAVSKKDKFDWKRANGGTPSLGTGPKTDHTTGTALGTFFFIETSWPQKAGDNAIIYTRRVFKANQGQFCFNFWYHMYGSHIGALNIYINSEKSTPIWTKTGDQGDVWRHGRVTIGGTVNYQVLIEGVTGTSYKGDIAIDDIWVDDYPCPAPGSCDFESQSFCSWSQVKNGNSNNTGFDDFDWELLSGSTPSYNTGPKVDHTKGTSLGTYAYIEVSNQRPNKKAMLVSETFKATKGKCLSFWYHMFGQDIGTLNFYVKDVNTRQLIKSIDGDQGDQWQQGEIGLHSQLDFQVVLEAVHGSSYRGDIALDDINIVDGNCVGLCSSVQPTARVACGPSSVTAGACVVSYGCCYDDSVPNVPSCFQHPSTCKAVPLIARSQCGYTGISQYRCGRLGCCYDATAKSFNCFNPLSKPTNFPPTLAPVTTPAPSKYDCDFDKGWCTFKNMTASKYNWSRQKGATGSWGTGPKADHTMSDEKGYYLYIETSNRKANDTANLLSPQISFPQAASKVCVRFWYHMFGQHVGAFNIFATQRTTFIPKNPIWSRKGSLVDEWVYGQFTVQGLSSFYVVFQGVRGSGYQGDIAIDDVGFVNGPCPPTMSCGFENNDTCAWVQDATDGFDWSIGSGNTTSISTGPKWDRTYQTGMGHYLYIEGSHPRQPGDIARIESFEHAPTQGSCFQFYYNMYGDGIGTLNIYIRRGKTLDTKPLWTLSGDQGQEWFRGLVTVEEDTTNWKLVIEAIRGGTFNSDIALDELQFTKGKCIPRGDCDFEDKNACGYENDPTNDVDWLVYSGSTPSYNTGPTVDHTTGLSTGTYLYMEASAPATKGDKGRFLSEKFKVNPNYKWCLEFYYHMFGEGVGTFRVQRRYKTSWSRGIYLFADAWSIEGNMGDEWRYKQLNITSSFDFQFVFEAEVGSGKSYRSDIALDDILIREGDCPAPTPPPTPNPCLRKCRDGSCVPSDKVCDFYPDCAQRSDNTDDSDEHGCDGCDFETVGKVAGCVFPFKYRGVTYNDCTKKDHDQLWCSKDADYKGNWENCPTGFCGWNDTSKAVFKWSRQQGRTWSYGTGPSKDHTKGTSGGYYAYVESSVGGSNNLATFASPTIKQASATCKLNFWYHMYGKDIGELDVYVVHGYRLTKLWTLSGSQGNEWKQGTVYINRQQNPFRIEFIATRASGWRGDIAIDDISLEDCSLPKPAQYCNGRYSFQCARTRACIYYENVCDYTDDCGDGSDEENCNHRYYPYRCDFEWSSCMWEDLKDDDFDFTRTKGLTDSTGTGPMVDHTTGTASGYYLYAEASYPRTKGDKARLGSGLLRATGFTTCTIRFYYHMTGYHIGALRVKVRECSECDGNVEWERSISDGNYWIRQELYLTADRPFQVVIEAEIGDGYSGDIAIDDVSFDGCKPYYGDLPPVIPTTPPITTTSPCAVGQFYCAGDAKCIDIKLTCDHRNDCSDGQDEYWCGSCDFERDMCGYSDRSLGEIQWQRSQPSTDSTSLGPRAHNKNATNVYFGMTKAMSGKKGEQAILHSKPLSPTAPKCKLQFSYFYNTTPTATLYVTVAEDINNSTVYSTILQTPVTRSSEWRTVQMGLGYRRQDWQLWFKTQREYVAIDDITLIDCAFPFKTGVCNFLQVGCDNGACINQEEVCDFANDCGDGSDEKPEICSASYKERCNFEIDTCNWYQDRDDDFDWTRTQGPTSSYATGPGIDHTLGTSKGYYMFIETSSPRKANDTARLLSAVFKPTTSCTMRFNYHMYGEHVDTLRVLLKRSDNPLSQMKELFSVSGNQDNMWHSDYTFINSEGKNFQVVIEAKRGVSYRGDISIDDISFAGDCVVDSTATLDPHAFTPSPPPNCVSGQFGCGDGQCISADDVCNFRKDCSNGYDESFCPSSCDFEDGSMCRWYNAYFSDILNWKNHQGKTPSNGTGPTTDHTTNTTNGRYIYMEVSNTQARYPNAHLVSPMYYSGAYNCKFTFYYNMWHYQRKSTRSDVKLNVYYRRDGKDTLLKSKAGTTGDKWQKTTVQLPPCPKDFRLVFEGQGYWKSLTDAAIDDWSFDCAEPLNPQCNMQTQFMCTQTKQCVSRDDLCDNERNCCDGSDEDLATVCKGYTKYDWQNGLSGWTQLSNDTFDFSLYSGRTATWYSGPKTDHTTGEEHGRYLYIEASGRTSNDTAMLASPTIDETTGGRCKVSFWYHMKGTHIGTLTVYTATTYGVKENKQWSMSGDQGNKWKKASILMSSISDFQVIFEGKIGSSYRGDIAIDDVVFGPGCVLNGKVLPGGPTPPPVDPCLPKFQCVKSGVCLPRHQVCDFVEDCEGGTDESYEACGLPQSFQNKLPPWRESFDVSYHFNIQTGRPAAGHTGPSTGDATGNKDGYYAYLDSSNKVDSHEARLMTPMYGGAYADCTMEFYYHMYGRNIGILEVDLITAGNATRLFELKGTQANKWVKTQVYIGRRKEPFYLNFTASVGGNTNGVVVNFGDIAIDEVSFKNCGHAPVCTGNLTGKFICSNARCIPTNKVCDLTDDCGDSSDENIPCVDYLGCSFEDHDNDPCNMTQLKNDDFDWTYGFSMTSSYNTGPTRDHTLGTSSGHYYYIEASAPRKAGEKARMVSLPIKARQGGKCTLRFYYHMFGKHVDSLIVYTMKENTKSMALKFKATGDYGDMWRMATVNLSAEYDTFRLVFEGIVGKSFTSDIAIDDVILSPDCGTNSSRIFPTPSACTSQQFTCKTGGQCISSGLKCDGTKDCKDGSDEFQGCRGATGKSKAEIDKQTSIMAASIVGGLVVLLIIVMVAYLIFKRKREKKLHLFSVFYDPTKQPEQDAAKEGGKGKDKAGVAIKHEGLSNPIYDEQPMGEFSMGDLDTDMFPDTAFPVQTESKGGATSMANPLYQDPYMEDDDSPLSNF